MKKMPAGQAHAPQPSFARGSQLRRPRYLPLFRRAVPLALGSMIVLAGLLVAQSPRADAPGQDIWSVRVPYQSRDDLQRLSRLIDHMHVDTTRKTATLEISTAEVDQLRAMGFTVDVDEQQSRTIQGLAAKFMQSWKQGAQAPAQTASHGKALLAKPGDPLFLGNESCYRTVEKTWADAHALAAQYPQLIRVVPVGQTWVQTQLMLFRDLLTKYMPQSWLDQIDLDLLPGQGANPLRAVVIGNRDRIKDRQVPRMVTTSSIHAREITPAEVSTRFAEWLVKGYGSDPTATWLLDNNEFHFILHANPDGRKLAEQGMNWRKNVNLSETEGLCAAKPQTSGIDLNRNFRFAWNSTEGKGSGAIACAETFRGTSAASEPETRAIIKYVAGELQADGSFAGGVLPDRRPADFVTPAPLDYEGVFMDLHSVSKVILWPWAAPYDAQGKYDKLNGSTKNPNDHSMSALAQRMAWHNGYEPTQRLYDADGSANTTMYGELGVPAFTIELGKTGFFEPCADFEAETSPLNLAALRYVARTLKAPYQLPLGPEATSIKLSASTVRQGDVVTLSALIEDDRYRYAEGPDTPPVTRHDPQPIKAANAYINKLPWDAGAKAIALSADAAAAFGSRPSVTVSGAIDTSKFAPGKHLIYVQGINQMDQAGPPDAVFLEVLAKDAPMCVAAETSAPAVLAALGEKR